MTKVMLNGEPMDMDVVVHYMDDEIREDLHNEGFDNDQDFVNAYVKAHEEKFGGEKFVIN